MLYIVEGFDNTGKSTLCNTLSRALDIPVLHSVGGPNVPRAVLYEWTVSSIVKGAVLRGMILDRIPIIGEPIYGPLLRGGSRITPKDLEDLWDRLTISGAAVIYCRPATHHILRTMNDRPQMAGVKDNSRRILYAYDHFMREEVARRVPVLTYSWDTDNVEGVIEWARTV